MKLARLLTTALAVSLCAAAPARAQSANLIPDNATVQCNDGSWASSANQRGACGRHKGVKHWIGRRPAHAAARCNDGEYWTNATLQGACSSHGGVFKSYKTEMKADAKADKREMKAEARADKREMKVEQKERKAEMKMDKRKP